MRKHQLFTSLVEALQDTTTQVSFNSRTSVFQTDDEGAIPSTRSWMWGPPSPSSLRSEPPPGKIRRCAPTGVPGTPFLISGGLNLSSRFSDEERGLQNRV